MSAVKPRCESVPKTKKSPLKPIKCDCGKTMYPFEDDGKVVWACEDDSCGEHKDSLGNEWNTTC